MKKSILRSFLGFTLIELLVVISIIGILASLAIPAVTGALVKGQMTAQLSNLKQLHLATYSMAVDGATTGDTSMGWPGNGTWSSWSTGLVNGKFMTLSEFNKMLSAPGRTVAADNAVGTKPTTSAVSAYKVGEDSESTTVFLSSANFDASAPKPAAPSATALPFGNKGFVIFRKGGDGVVLKESQATNTNLIGLPAGAL